jgi:hypothetical protein
LDGYISRRRACTEGGFGRQHLGADGQHWGVGEARQLLAGTARPLERPVRYGPRRPEAKIDHPTGIEYKRKGRTMISQTSVPGLLLAAILISGCTTLPDLKARLDAAPSCCVGFEQMQFDPLPAEGDILLALDDRSPAFNFETGKSYFAAYSLPATAQGKQLQVLAHPTGSIAFESQTLAQIFCPRVLFLNSSKRPMSTHEVVGQFDRLNDFSGYMRGAGSAFDIPPQAAFVVVHANPQVFGNLRSMRSRGGAYMVGTTLVMQRGGESSGFPCAPNADAKIRVR